MPSKPFCMCQSVGSPMRGPTSEHCCYCTTRSDAVSLQIARYPVLSWAEVRHERHKTGAQAGSEVTGPV